MKPTFEPNPDTRLLTDVLLALKHGEVLTHEDMAKLLSRRIDGADPALQSARRRAEREDGFVFTAVRKVGIRRLTDEEIVGLGETGAKSIRRASRRYARRVANVGSFDALSAADKAKHNGALALFGAVMAATKASTLRRLEGAANSTGQLSLGRTFDLFKGEK